MRFLYLCLYIYILIANETQKFFSHHYHLSFIKSTHYYRDKFHNYLNVVLKLFINSSRLFSCPFNYPMMHCSLKCKFNCEHVYLGLNIFFTSFLGTYHEVSVTTFLSDDMKRLSRLK